MSVVISLPPLPSRPHFLSHMYVNIGHASMFVYSLRPHFFRSLLLCLRDCISCMWSPILFFIPSCICVCLYIRIHQFFFSFLLTYVCVYIYVYTSVPIYIYMYVHIYIYIYTICIRYSYFSIMSLIFVSSCPASTSALNCLPSTNISKPTPQPELRISWVLPHCGFQLDQKSSNAVFLCHIGLLHMRQGPQIQVHDSKKASSQPWPWPWLKNRCVDLYQKNGISIVDVLRKRLASWVLLTLLYSKQG